MCITGLQPAFAEEAVDEEAGGFAAGQTGEGAKEMEGASFHSLNQIIPVGSDDELLAPDAHNVSSDQRGLSLDQLPIEIGAGAIEVIEPHVIAAIHDQAVTAGHSCAA